VRVINDRDEKSAQSELGFFAIAAHALFTSLGIATVVLAPLPMIAAHERLPEPWPKVTALFGALLALAYIQVPVHAVVTGFIFGLFVSDSVKRLVPLWPLLSWCMLVAAVLGLSSVAFASYSSGLKPLDFWTGYWSEALIQLKKSVPPESIQTIDWPALQTFFVHESPFVYVSWSMLSAWLSVGIAAHLGWLPPEHKLSGASLRALRLPRWLSIVFVVIFGAALISDSSLGNLDFLFLGLFFILGTLMFIQGCISLSDILSRRVVSPAVKTFLYSIAIIPGFPALMGVGVMSPWFFRRKES
jgi:hypothetical protein